MSSDAHAALDEYLRVVKKWRRNESAPGSPSIWSPELECASADEVRAIQDEKVAAAYRYLFEGSPFYRRRFTEAGLDAGAVRSVADLPSVPVTRKLDWMADIEQSPPWGTFSPLLSERWHEGAGWMVFSTSGTTRQPRVFRFTHHDREMLGWLCARALWSYGVTRADLAFNCFYYGPSVAAWGMQEGLGRLGCPLVSAGPMPMERKAFFVKLLRPTVLLGTPSTLLTLAVRLRELGEDPERVGVRILGCAGEAGAAVTATRQRLREAWGGARVHDDFGCTEVAQAPLGYTCTHEVEKDAGPVCVHFSEDAHVVEVLDPVTLKPVGRGERGTLVVSNLYSEAAPFLRYDMGDWVEVSDEQCACGRTQLRAVGGLLGRNDHCLKIRGLQFFPSTFEDAIRSIPMLGDEYRVEVSSQYRQGQPSDGSQTDVTNRRAHRDEVTLIVERSCDTAAAALGVEEIARRLRGILGITLSVTVCEPGALPRSEGKGARFVDRRTPS